MEGIASEKALFASTTVGGGERDQRQQQALAAAALAMWKAMGVRSA